MTPLVLAYGPTSALTVRNYLFTATFNRFKAKSCGLAKTVKCDVITVKYWFKRWKQAKDLRDSIQSGRLRGTTHKQDEQIVSLAEQQTFVTAQDIGNKLRKAGATVNEKERYNGVPIKRWNGLELR